MDIIDKPNEPPFGGKGMTKEERHATHERWCQKGRASSSLKPGTQEHEMYEQGKQCGGCAFYLTLDGDLGMDWGACACPKSPHDGTTVFEHFTCLHHEYRPDPDEDEKE